MTPKQLKRIRAQTGLSQSAFGKETGYSKSAIANMEGGIMPIVPRAEKVFKNIVDKDGNMI